VTTIALTMAIVTMEPAIATQGTRVPCAMWCHAQMIVLIMARVWMANVCAFLASSTLRLPEFLVCCCIDCLFFFAA
jgi:hypothetical protein